MNDLLFFFFSLALSKKYVCFNMKRYRKIQNILILRFICFVSVFTSFILVVCVCIYILESNVLILYEKATPMCPMCLSRVATCWGWVTRRSLEDTLLVMWTEAHLTMMLFKRTKGLALKEEGKKKKTLKKKIFRAVQLFQETAQRSDAEPWWEWLKPVHY